MRYDEWYERPPTRARRGSPSRPYRGRPDEDRLHRGRPDDLPESERRTFLPRPDRRRPFPIEGRGYTGRGEARRYGNAPVPYGPEHTYDYHMGDRYGYGPDFVRGEERIRQRRLPELRPRRRPRR